jgi:hypothetical protein
MKSSFMVVPYRSGVVRILPDLRFSLSYISIHITRLPCRNQSRILRPRFGRDIGNCDVIHLPKKDGDIFLLELEISTSHWWICHRCVRAVDLFCDCHRRVFTSPLRTYPLSLRYNGCSFGELLVEVNQLLFDPFDLNTVQN